MKKILMAGIAALSLAACETAPTQQISAPQGATAQQALNGFVFTVAIATVIDRACRRGGGVGLRNPNTYELTSNYVVQLTRQGYSSAELKRASSRIDNKVMAQKAITYLQDRGVQRGNRASVCTAGKNEMAAGTGVGKLLKRI